MAFSYLPMATSAFPDIILATTLDGCRSSDFLANSKAKTYFPKE